MSYIREVILSHDGDECLIWPFFRDKNGYGSLSRDGKTETVSRIVCREAHGEPPAPDYEAAHLCGKGNLGCCAKRHLFWKTHAANVADQRIHGTIAHGERNGHAKITNAQAEEIRALSKSMRQGKIAAKYGLSQSATSRIIRGESYCNQEGKIDGHLSNDRT